MLKQLLHGAVKNIGTYHQNQENKDYFIYIRQGTDFNLSISGLWSCNKQMLYQDKHCSPTHSLCVQL